MKLFSFKWDCLMYGVLQNKKGLYIRTKIHLDKMVPFFNVKCELCIGENNGKNIISVEPHRISMCIWCKSPLFFLVRSYHFLKSVFCESHLIEGCNKLMRTFLQWLSSNEIIYKLWFTELAILIILIIKLWKYRSGCTCF